MEPRRERVPKPLPSSRYSEAEVQQILARAWQAQTPDGVSREQLAQIATELGIDQKNLEQAEQEWLAERDARTQQEAATHRLRQEFAAHLASYITVCLGLVVLNLIIGGYFWAIWPLLGWGIGVAMHGIPVFLSWRRERVAGVS